MLHNVALRDCKEIYTQTPTTSLMSSNSLSPLQNKSETGYLLFTFSSCVCTVYVYLYLLNLSRIHFDGGKDLSEYDNSFHVYLD